ncbi:MAG: DUF2206 domain-containing protein [Halobacteriota archaeon]
MQVPNPFTANDWDIRSFLLTVVVLQCAVFVLIALDVLGFHVPILRQLFTFGYLVFVPGLLLLRTFRIHKLGSVETALFTAGLSIAALMFIGLVMNTALPVLGFDAPISLLPVTVVLAGFVAVFGALSYVRDKNFSDTEKWDCAQIFSAPYLFFILLPFLSIIGAYVMNAFSINLVLELLLLIIACAFIVLISSKKIPTHVYPLAVFSISLSLLFYWSLISNFLTGYDVLGEYFNAHLVLQNAVWDPFMPSLYNGVLSVVMLAPFLSLLSNLSLVWVFKIVYPVLFSLVPVGLFWVYKRLTDDKVAFLAVAYIMSLTSFFVYMPGLARQEIAEIFVVLALLLVVDRKIEATIKTGLFIIFLSALAVSHYTISYIFIGCLVTALLILSLQKNGALIKWKAKLISLLSNEDQAGGSVNRSAIARESLVTVARSSYFIVCVLSWYAYVSAGSAIDKLSGLAQNISSHVSSDLLSPSTSQGAAIIVSQPTSPLHAVTKYFYLVSIGLVIIGLLATWLKPTMRLNREISAFFVPACALLAAAIALPFLAGQIQTDRLLHIGLLFLAPLFPIGALAVGGIARAIAIRRRATSENMRTWVLRGLSVFLAVFLLLNSGLIYEVVHDHPTSIALDKTVASPVFDDMETTASLWLQNETPPNAQMYADSYHYTLLLTITPDSNVRTLWVPSTNFSAELPYNYIFLGTTNVANKEFYIAQISASDVPQYANVSTSEISQTRSLLYDNGGAQVYL